MFGLILITIINSAFIAYLGYERENELTKVKGCFAYVVTVFIWIGLFVNDVLGPVDELKDASGWIFVIAIFGPFLFGNLLLKVITKK